jgi:hypothetical protein
MREWPLAAAPIILICGTNLMIAKQAPVDQIS